MSKSVSYFLIGLAILLILFGFAEHIFFRILIVPHLAIIVGVVAVILAAIGIYGLLRAGASNA